ncbi:MAG: ECF-type sigma factor [Acidobacteriota bacterium]
MQWSLDSDTTRLLHAWSDGDVAARDVAIEKLYPSLKALVGQIAARGGLRSPLDTTELVHETYLKLSAQEQASWRNRGHFFALAARLVRRLIVDHLRRQSRDKRGGDVVRLHLDEARPELDVALRVAASDLELLDLDRALERLEAIDPQAARVVEMRYFVGLGHDETAQALGIGRATVSRSWRFGRAWLRAQLAA